MQLHQTSMQISTQRATCHVATCFLATAVDVAGSVHQCVYIATAYVPEDRTMGVDGPCPKSNGGGPEGCGGEGPGRRRDAPIGGGHDRSRGRVHVSAALHCCKMEAR